MKVRHVCGGGRQCGIVFRNRRLRDFNPNPMSRWFALTMTGALFCRLLTAFCRACRGGSARQ